jgi:serine phosphatase RsbU (regulator of sigma subunit)
VPTTRADFRSAWSRADWAATPLGPEPAWSPALRGAVDMALQTRFAVTLFWGPQFTMVYNEAYVRMIGDKHPQALGAPARDVFPEAWDIIGPMMESVRAGGEATWVEDEYVPLLRHGFLEECYFTFSYSAVRGTDGTVEGVIDIAAETTNEVHDRRRLDVLARLNAALLDMRSADELVDLAMPVLRPAAADLTSVRLRTPTRGGERHGPAMQLVDRPGGPTAVLSLGGSPSGDRPVLEVGLNPQLAPDDRYLSFLRLVRASLVQALDRADAQVAERRIAAAQRGMSEALQRSLLTRAPRLPGLEVAVRYHPAAEEAHIGGDWYDAFEMPGGSLVLVVGDVAGHDRAAAATMAQLRNVLRGVTYTLAAGPAAALSGLDRAVHGLAIDAVATAVLATVGPADPSGNRLLRWSNAGHPPPVLVEPDGRARLLERDAETLLGLETVTRRSDQEELLRPGSTVVLFTDGLVERRGVSLDDSLDWLLTTLSGRTDRTAEDVCDHLLGEVRDPLADDVALLVMRVC